ncbi:MAG: HAD-IB family phosphatase [Deltaproteobacteria bacterium]|nr:HAD-IB family phosphatase [Deltaproteobacteria bacterium]
MIAIPSWLEPFSGEFQEAILPVLEKPGRRVACFDADGTLWSEDLGEAFLRWLVAGALLPTIDCSKDVYAEYEARVDRDQCAGYSWAVECMSGIPEEKVNGWSRQLAAAWPNYRPSMFRMMRGLSEAGVEVWWVSATNQWSVRAAAGHKGFNPERVLGIRGPVSGGVLTGQVERPVTCRGGKVDAIREIIGKMPDLACGDSRGDLEMMEVSDQPLVVARRDKGENEFLRGAAENGWPVHWF